MSLDQPDHTVKHTKGMRPLPVSSLAQSPPQRRTLDFHEHVVEMPRRSAWVEPSLQSKELRRKGLDRREFHDESGKHHEWRSTRSGVRGFKPTGFVDVAGVHRSVRNYGRPKAAVGRGVRPEAYAPM